MKITEIEDYRNRLYIADGVDGCFDFDRLLKWVRELDEDEDEGWNRARLARPVCAGPFDILDLPERRGAEAFEDNWAEHVVEDIDPGTLAITDLTRLAETERE